MRLSYLNTVNLYSGKMAYLHCVRPQLTKGGDDCWFGSNKIHAKMLHLLAICDDVICLDIDHVSCFVVYE